MKRLRFVIILLICFWFAEGPAHGAMANDTARFSTGVQRILFSAFQLPFHLIQNTVRGPIGVGTVYGAAYGTIRTVSEMSGGLFDMAAASAPYAKYAVLF